MRNVWTVYKREVAGYFNSPVAYIFICLFLAILAFIYFVVMRFHSQESPDVRDFFGWLPWVLAIFVPAVTMRLWAEEKRMGTQEILLTLPLESWQVVTGKYLAGFTVVGVALVLTLFVPITVSFLITVDWGVVFTSFLGSVVISSVYLAMGAWASTFTRDQVVALLIAVFFSLVACLIGITPVINFLNGLVQGLGNFVGWFGPLYHFEDFSRGLINPVGLIYGVSLTVFFLILNNVFVEGRKF